MKDGVKDVVKVEQDAVPVLGSDFFLKAGCSTHLFAIWLVVISGMEDVVNTW